jgi:hypothetical protein
MPKMPMLTAGERSADTSATTRNAIAARPAQVMCEARASLNSGTAPTAPTTSTTASFGVNVVEKTDGEKTVGRRAAASAAASA